MIDAVPKPVTITKIRATLQIEESNGKAYTVVIPDLEIPGHDGEAHLDYYPGHRLARLPFPFLDEIAPDDDRPGDWRDAWLGIKIVGRVPDGRQMAYVVIEEN